MATKLVPKPAGIPGKQLEFNFNKKVPTKKEEQKPATHKVPKNQKGTYQSLRFP